MKKIIRGVWAGVLTGFIIALGAYVLIVHIRARCIQVDGQIENIETELKKIRMTIGCIDADLYDHIGSKTRKQYPWNK